MDNLHSGLHDIVDHREHADITFANDVAQARPRAAKAAAAPTTTAGSGWYHDAAIAAAGEAAIEARCNPYHH